MSELFFGRTITALVTPFAEDGSLDFDALHRLVNRQLAAGIDAFVVGASTGEAATLSHDERLALFAAVHEQAAGAAKTIAYVGSNNTAASVEFARETAATGHADGFLVVVPYYNKPPQEGLYRHFEAVAKASDVPVMLYNIPARSVVNMEAETTLRLARECETIVAIKEASGKMDQIQAIIDGAPDGFFVYSGEDSDTVEVIERGGAGVVSTTSNVAPARMTEIVAAAAAGDFTRARELEAALMPLMKGLFMTSNPIMVKDALTRVGCPVGAPRLPLVPATSEQGARLASILEECGAIA